MRCYTSETINGLCRDYRATATCDFGTDTADEDRKLEMPLLPWRARGHSPERAQRSLDTWREYAGNIEAWDPLNCGHYMQEETPEEIYGHYTKCFKA